MSVPRVNRAVGKTNFIRLPHAVRAEEMLFHAWMASSVGGFVCISSLIGLIIFNTVIHLLKKICTEYTAGQLLATILRLQRLSGTMFLAIIMDSLPIKPIRRTRTKRSPWPWRSQEE